MELTGWGKYPVIDSDISTPLTRTAIKNILTGHRPFRGIARGLGRSYGDSALARQVVSTAYLDHLLAFDDSAGLLTCAAGLSLAEILRIFVPRGWFLAVTPGTKFVTVGGAIASDVHGKNHHGEGSFSDHVESFHLVLADGNTVNCSREENSELFHATCGGMGLTGIIVDATFRLRPVSSAYIDATLIKAANLQEALELFETYHQSTYSVAWIDCLATGSKLGRSLLMLGEHAGDGPLLPGKQGALTVPMDMPGCLLNHYSIQAFNTLYYHRMRQQRTQRVVHYEPFFYPLDSIHYWNRIYGKGGFTQYQFVVPREAGLTGMTTILNRIAQSKRGSFLAVLKTFGVANANHLSFPMEGYTLALDFKLDRELFPLLDELDRSVLDFDGRLYLCKDVRMSEATFKQGYPRWEQFAGVRRRYGADTVFNSLQSQRLGL